MIRKDIAWQSESLASKYLDHIRGAIPLALEQLDVMLRVIDAGCQPNQFLDLGCGSGILSAAILDRYPNARGILVDFSAPMLKAAREHLHSHSNQLTFIHGDLATDAWFATIPRDVYFDAVVSGYAIHHLENERKQELFKEIHDRLVPGGAFINIEHVSSETPWVESLFERKFVDTLFEREQSVEGKATREELAKSYYHRYDKKANILVSVEQQCGWLRQLGFKDVDCYFKLFELAVFGGRR